MGAGCHYTNEDGSRAIWIEIPEEAQNNPDSYDYWTEELYTRLDQVMENDKTFEFYTPEQNKGVAAIESCGYVIKLEPSYYGDGLVFKMEAHENLDGSYSLLMHNMAKSYFRIMKKIIKAFEDQEFRIATSRYTSCKVDQDLTIYP